MCLKKTMRTVMAVAITSVLATSNAVSAGKFEEVSVIFEQNATEGNVEVVFEINGGDEALETLIVRAPNGRTIINATFIAGMRELEFESPEPPDQVALLKKNYPEGMYHFYAITLSGELLHAMAPLSHALPETTTFLSPGKDATGVPLNQSISWSAVLGAVGYIVEIENDDLDAETTIQVPASTTTIEPPAGFLLPGTEYELQISTIGADGNISFVETSFLTAGNQSPDDDYNPVIEPANFVTTIDNPYFPLVPGTTYTYKGETEDGLEEIKVFVTDETKEILGVTCVVVRDTVTVDGELVEDTYDWYAQDKAGNVWYMGEDSKEYEDGEVVSTEGSWEAGVDGAKPGIIWQANPQVGESYRQEYYAGEAEDMAEVVSLNESVTVPNGSYNTIQTKEWTPLEPGVLEYNYYASGVGAVLEVNPETGERVELVNISVQ
jgi:hypothetical protein